MSESGRPISEEDLHAYVDGQLAAERRPVLEAYVRDHPDAAERVATDLAQRNALRAAFARHAEQPIPAQLNLTRLVEQRLRRRHVPWRIAAGVALLVVAGSAGGWWLGSRQPSGVNLLAREAAMNYAVYAMDQRRPVELTDAHREEMARWLSHRLDRQVAPPDLSASGYTLLGGRLAASPHGAAALFVYQDTAGRRLVLYVRPMANGPQTTPIHPFDVDRMDGCAWIEQGLGYSVIAAASSPQLMELSRYVRQEVGPHG